MVYHTSSNNRRIAQGYSLHSEPSIQIVLSLAMFEQGFYMNKQQIYTNIDIYRYEMEII